MALENSAMMALGTRAPDFNLPDGSGNLTTLSEAAGSKGLLVAFICNHCPFVKHVAVALETVHLELQKLGVNMVAINANDAASYPDDSPEKMLEFVEQHGFTFPYLYDESQQVARAYDARCTPDFFLFDANLKLFYRGQLDDSRPGNDAPLTGEDILAAARALADGDTPPEQQKPSIGCNIKWRES